MLRAFLTIFAVLAFGPQIVRAQGSLFPPTQGPGWSCPAPLNDAFTNALVLTGHSLMVSATNTCASAEPNEPNHAGSGPARSVWFDWTAPLSGQVAIDAFRPLQRSSNGTVIQRTRYRLGVYRGTSLETLEPLSEVPRPSGVDTNWTIVAVNAGDRIKIAVDAPSTAPPFDFSSYQFDLAVNFVGLDLTWPSQTTFEVGESVDFDFAATGSAGVTTFSAWIDAALIGERATLPTRVTHPFETNGLFRLSATASLEAGTQLKMLPRQVRVRPVNDDFKNATALPGFFVRRSISYRASGATAEPTEPFYSAPSPVGLPMQIPGASMWWKWTPEKSAFTRVRSGNSTLYVFRGASLPTLETVGISQPDRIILTPWGGGLTGGFNFDAEAGETYWFSAPFSEDNGTNTWVISQDFNILTGEATATAEQAWTLRVADGFAAYSPVQLSATVKKQVPNALSGMSWTSLFQTNLVVGPGHGWSWIPEAEGTHLIQLSGTLANGESITSEIHVKVLSANDPFEFAIPIRSSAIPSIQHFQTGYASTEETEPPQWTNSPQRSLWWKWTPEQAASVRFKAVVPGQGGLPLDVFTGSDLSDLVRVSHNDSRALTFPLEGLVPLEATAGTTYFIRVSDPRADGSTPNPTNGFLMLPTVRTHLSLVMEPLDAPQSGLVGLTTATGALQEDGSILWDSWARVFQEDGIHWATNNSQVVAQFFVGSTPDRLHPYGIAVAIASLGPASLAGTVTQGLAGHPGINAGDDLYVQLRAWDGGFGRSYETARAQGALIGRSQILRLTAGSELGGAALPRELANVILAPGPSAFAPGLLSPVGIETGHPVWELSAPTEFIYAIEASDLVGGWETVLTVTNVTGTVRFTDPRPEKPPVSIYRSRIVD